MYILGPNNIPKDKDNDILSIDERLLQCFVITELHRIRDMQ